MTRPRQEPHLTPPHRAAPCRVKAPAVGAHAPRFDDDIRDHRGRRYCTCGRVETHPMHQLPDAPAEARQRDNAVLGEHEEN